MKIDCSIKLKDPFCRDIIERAGDPPLSVGVACAHAFLVPHPNDQDLSMTDKVAMYDLAARFAKGGEIDLSDDELSLVRKRVADVFHISVMGAILDVIGR